MVKTINPGPTPLTEVKVINETKNQVALAKQQKKDKVTGRRMLSTEGSIKLHASQKPTVAIIEEALVEEDDEAAPASRTHSFKRNGSHQGSKNSNYTQRSSSISRTSLTLQTCPAGIANANPGLQTTNSSLRGSVRSLPVMREQYCCCQRWTFLERTLLKAVAVLAIIIIGLIIAVGILAKSREIKHNREQQTFMWAL